MCSGKHIFPFSSECPLVNSNWVECRRPGSLLCTGGVFVGRHGASRKRERERKGERKKGKREREGGRENGKDVCKSMSMADSSTKSPDIYSTLLTNLEKKECSFLLVSFPFIHSLTFLRMRVCAGVSELVYSIHNNGNESKGDV